MGIGRCYGYVEERQDRHIWYHYCHKTVSLNEVCNGIDLEARGSLRQGFNLNLFVRTERASLEFKCVFGQEPQDDDVLSFEHVRVVRGPMR